jgi:hypothetical protein
MLPKLNRRRALFVLTKIDEILMWEQRKEAERDTRFVELGRYLCEVRADQYWRLEKLKSFDEFLERRFPEDTSVQFNYLPALRALLAFDRVEHESAQGFPEGSRSLVWGVGSHNLPEEKVRSCRESRAAEIAPPRSESRQ